MDLCMHVARDKSEIGWDVRIALSAYGSFSSRAYLNAQRIRSVYITFWFYFLIF